MQDETKHTVQALCQGDLSSAEVTEKERVLLEFAELLTRHAYRNTPDQIDRLRAVGWNDQQIAEAVYIIALFAFFNRVADGFGLDEPKFDDRPASEQACSQQDG